MGTPMVAEAGAAKAPSGQLHMPGGGEAHGGVTQPFAGTPRCRALPAGARRPGPRALLQEMHRPQPTLVGGTAATLMLLLYPPVAHALAAEPPAASLPLDPCRRLIPGWLTAVTGDASRAEQLRRRAAGRHSRVQAGLPAEAGPKFGRRYRAGDPGHMRTACVVFLRCFLAAQERTHRRLAAGERDQYRWQAKVPAGWAFCSEAIAPASAAALQRACERIAATRLQPTSFGREAARAMLTAHIGGIPGRGLAHQAATILDRRVTDGPGIHIV